MCVISVFPDGLCKPCCKTLLQELTSKLEVGVCLGSFSSRVLQCIAIYLADYILRIIFPRILQLYICVFTVTVCLRFLFGLSLYFLRPP